MISIHRLTKANSQILKDINALVLQLSSRGYQMKLTHLQKAISNKENYIFVVVDGKKIIGMGTLVTLFQMTGRKAYMEDVVVDETYRGQGLGKRLVTHMVDTARKKGIESLELKSESYRVAANNLYRSLGFEQKDANIYKVSFKK